ncbi:hypothetical protein AMTR_s00022p00191580 [Amborella trichopoda]|uniref:S-locus glycoprotein domain-containing protein n=1 Tax=Amborella trichopoda TaxID=13333 RepID=W1PNL0_AMBTC|nr:hypothetical protein AMTR_s00022p00191580 [Amborella trichopoda]
MENDYGPGRFLLELEDDGNVVQYPKGRQNPDSTYYKSGTNRASYDVLVFNSSGPLYLMNSMNQLRKNILSKEVDSPELYHLRATLDSDGIFQQYFIWKNRGRKKWNAFSRFPSDIGPCEVPGACGVNGYCVVDQDRKAKCQCPRKCSFVNHSYQFGGCKPDFITGCIDYKRSEYTIIELDNLNWPNGDYELLEIDEGEWIKACMEDCFCDAAIYGDNQCWKKNDAID